MGIFASGQKPTASRLNAIANSASISNAVAAGNTSSTSYGDFPATSSFSFTKLNDSTALEFDLNATLYSTVNTTGVLLAVRINGVDNDAAKFFFNDANSHRPVVGGCRVTGLAAGAYTVQVRWRRTSGTGQLTTDTEDWLRCKVMEVQ